MAATLMQIKARTILPSDNHSDLNGPDPREELVQKLLEYQKFKEAARFLSQGYELQKDVYYRGAPLFSKEDQVLDLDLTKLLDAFNKVLQSTDKGIRDILVEEIPIEVRIREVLDMLESKPFIAFSELFPEGSSRRTLIITFLALLELIRLHQARVTQMAHFDEILIAKFADQNFVLEQETPAAEEVIKN
jgi:segregation and condensation protein A